MKLNLKEIFIGLAGLSAVSGAGYYLYKKNYCNPNDGTYILKCLRQLIFKQKNISFDIIMSTFNQAYNLSIGKYVFELSKQNQDTEAIETKICMKKLSKSSYYECTDCLVQLQKELNKDSDEENKTYYSHKICEDCFDHKIHKGHSYKLTLSGFQGYCDCGSSYRFNEKSFCSQHCGLQSVKSDFEKSLSDEHKNSIMQYYKELLYILIDGQSDLIYNSMKKEKMELGEICSQPNFFDKFNSFFYMILESLRQTIDLYHPLIYCFAELLKSNFNKPTRINSCLYELILNDSKNIEENETIFGYLFKYQIFFNKKNHKILCKLLKIISSTDQEFAAFIFSSYIRYISFAYYKFCTYDNAIENQELITYCPTKLSKMCYYEYFNPEVIYDVCNKKSSSLEILNLISYFHVFLNEVSFFLDDDSEIFIQLFQMIETIFDIPQVINQFMYIEELIEHLADMTYIVFQKIQLFPSTSETGIYNNFLKNLNMVIFPAFCSFIFDLWYKITVQYHRQQLSKLVQETILKVLSKKFKKSINSHQEKMIDSQGQILNYFGFSYCSLIICIIIMSEGINLSETDVRNAFLKNFDFENESEMNDFINKTVDILHHNLISFCYHENASLFIPITILLKKNTNSSNQLQKQWGLIQKAELTIYDSHVLAYQLLTSVQDNPSSFLGQLPLNISKKASINWSEDYLSSTKALYLLYQIYFDQTPFININKKLNNILTKDNELFQDKIEYATKQVINNILKKEGDNIQTYQQLFNQINNIILDEELIKKILPKFGEIDEFNDLINLKPLDELQNTSLNLARYSINFVDFGLQSPSSLVIFRYIPGVLSQLFDYQRKLVVKGFSDFNLFVQLREAFTNPNNQDKIIQPLNSLYIIWLDLIQQFEMNTSLFSEEEKSSILILKNALYSLEAQKSINPSNEPTQIDELEICFMQGIQALKSMKSRLNSIVSQQQEQELVGEQQEQGLEQQGSFQVQFQNL